MQKGIDADYGTVAYKGSVIHVYIGRHPDLSGIDVNASKMGDSIGLLYAGTIDNGKQYLSLHGYANKVVIGSVKTIDGIFITLSAKDDPVNRRQISAVGANLVRCR